jgi:hypothetical protein
MDKQTTNILLDYVGILIKLIGGAAIVVTLLFYVCLDLVAQKTIAKAEINGYLDKAVYQDYVNSLGFLNTEVVEVSPLWGEKVEKLGDPLTLTIKNNFPITIFGKDLNIEFKVTKTGINQGYYSGGY